MSSFEGKVLNTFDIFRKDINEVIESHNLLFTETSNHIAFSDIKIAEIERNISDFRKIIHFTSYTANKANSDFCDAQKKLDTLFEEIKDIKHQLLFYKKRIKELNRYVNDIQKANSDAIVDIWNRLKKLEGKAG